MGGENNKCDDKLEGGTDGEGDLKNRQPNSQSKDKNPLGEIKAGAMEQWKQQGSQCETAADR